MQRPGVTASQLAEIVCCEHTILKFSPPPATLNFVSRNTVLFQTIFATPGVSRPVVVWCLPITLPPARAFADLLRKGLQ